MIVEEWGHNKKYQVEIKINPLPSSCMDCPFYQHWGTGDYGEDIFDCILHPIEDNFGIAIHRYKDCPLEK